VYVACKQYKEDHSEIKLQLHTHSMPKVSKTSVSADEEHVANSMTKTTSCVTKRQKA